MNLLRAERDTLEAYLPGLDKYLAGVPAAGAGAAGQPSRAAAAGRSPATSPAPR